MVRPRSGRSASAATTRRAARKSTQSSSEPTEFDRVAEAAAAALARSRVGAPRVGLVWAAGSAVTPSA
jgi:hypothetical protein